MSVTCTPASLIEAAKCFKCIPPGMRDAVKTYLLAVAAGGSIDPSTLMQAAKDFQKIPPGLQDMVQLYLMCDWPGVGICSHPIVTDWLQRLADDYQPMPSTQTIQAICDFCDRLTMYGLEDKLLVVNPVIPDSLLAMRYPLIYQPGNGNSPFINVNFLGPELNEDGILGNGASKYFNTGFVPSVHWTDTPSAGISVYQSIAGFGAALNEVEVGSINSVAGSILYMQTYEDVAGQTNAGCWNGNDVTFVQIETPAFYTVNRTSNVVLTLHQANSGIAFSLRDTDVNNAAGDPRPDYAEFFMALDDDGTPAGWTTKRVSFMAIHEGLTPTEAEDLYWCVHFLRVDLGGGYV